MSKTEKSEDMKIKKFLGYILMLVGIGLAVATVAVAFANLQADPDLLGEDTVAQERIVTMMDAFCAGDYATAQSVLQGETDLGVDRQPADQVGQIIWEAFQSSMTYELVGERYATNSGIAQDIVITTMDVDAVMDYVEANAKTVLEQRVNERLESQSGLDEIYDEENQYRDEFVMSVVHDVTRAAVENNTEKVQTKLTLNLVWEDDQWWVVPNEALLDAVSGGILG